MLDTLRLTAEEATRLASGQGGVERRALRRLPRGDRRARSGAPLLPPRLRGRRRRGGPARGQGRDRDEGDPDDRGLEDPRGLRARVRRDGGQRCKAHGLRVLGKTNTDEFAMGSSTENSAYGPTEPVGPDARAGRLRRRLGGGRRGGARAVGARLRHRRLDQAAGRACGNVGLRPTYGTVSRSGVVAFASSLDRSGRSRGTFATARSSIDPRRPRSVRHDDRRPAERRGTARGRLARRRAHRRSRRGSSRSRMSRPRHRA